MTQPQSTDPNAPGYIREWKCPHCSAKIYTNCTGQTRDLVRGGHHHPGGEACIRILKRRIRVLRGQVKAARVDVAKEIVAYIREETRSTLETAWARVIELRWVLGRPVR